MNLFNVYPLFDIEITKGIGCRIYDNHGIEYLDLYGGHAVISIVFYLSFSGIKES